LTTGAATRLFEFRPDRSWWYGKGLIASPGGDGVIYVHDGRMVLHHIESGKEEELYRDAHLAVGMTFTPDGSQLAFAIQGSVPPTPALPAKKFMIMPARGGEARELATIAEPEPAGIVGWTSDGRYLLLFQREEKGRAGRTVMRVPREGGKAERLWESAERMFGLSPSPDGRRVAYITQENEAEIWVLENIKEALARAR
jgi:Tol biopolymer transport system component